MSAYQHTRVQPGGGILKALESLRFPLDIRLHGDMHAWNRQLAISHGCGRLSVKGEGML